MATASQYGQFALHLLNKRIDWVNDDIRAAWFKPGYTPDRDAHDFYDDTVAGTNESTATGYTANGQALAGKAVAYDSATDQSRATASDSVWTTVTSTAGNGPQYVVIYDRTPATDATRPLISYINFGAVQVINGVNFTLDYDTTGVVRFVAAAEA